MDVMMMGALLLIVTCLALVAYMGYRLKTAGSAQKVMVHSSIDQLKAIGELSVFKAVTKEIVTQFDHDWGAFGQKWLSWLYSSKKMAMIFEFEIDFRYDLRKSEFEIVPSGEGSYRVRMPACFYDVRIRNISFYDEQGSKLMPWLLPDTLNGLFGKGFGEEEKNQMVALARTHAEQQAQRLINSLTSEVEASARATLSSIGKAFGAQSIQFDFSQQTQKLDVQMNMAA